MRFWKEEKAQGTTEYLLIIGGAVLVATAVGLYVKQATVVPTEKIKETQEELVK